jgi:hypothetical protein
MLNGCRFTRERLQVARARLQAPVRLGRTVVAAGSLGHGAAFAEVAGARRLR